MNAPKFEVVPQQYSYGTALFGYLTCPYCKLIERLGEPEHNEWNLVFKDDDGRDSFAFIYHYHEDNEPVSEQIRRWEVGGSDPKVLELVGFILDQPVETLRATK